MTVLHKLMCIGTSRSGNPYSLAIYTNSRCSTLPFLLRSHITELAAPQLSLQTQGTTGRRRHAWHVQPGTERPESALSTRTPVRGGVCSITTPYGDLTSPSSFSPRRSSAAPDYMGAASRSEPQLPVPLGHIQGLGWNQC